MNVLFELDKTYEQGKADGVKEVLEQIKAEMESRVKINNDLENYDIATGLSMALGILDKHIAELKGENNV